MLASQDVKGSGRVTSPVGSRALMVLILKISSLWYSIPAVVSIAVRSLIPTGRGVIVIEADGGLDGARFMDIVGAWYRLWLTKAPRNHISAGIPNLDLARSDLLAFVPQCIHSSLSRCSNRVKTTCLLVSSISPARKTSSSIA